MVGTKLKRLRKQKRLTQEVLSRGIISVSYLSAIENNQKELPDHLLSLFADRLEVSTEFLLGTEDKERSEGIKLQLQEARDLLYRDQYEEADTLLRAVPLLVKDYYNVELQIDMSIVKAMYYINSGNITQAEEIIDRLMLYDIFKYPNLYFRFLRIVGVIHYHKGNYLLSIERYKQAFELDIDADIDVDIDKIAVDNALLFNNMGISYFRLGHVHKALSYIKEAINKFQKSGCLYNAVEAQITLGGIYYKMQDWKKSYQLFLNISKVSVEIGNVNLEARVFHYLGMIHLQLKNVELGISYLEKALAYKREIGNSRDYSATLVELAEAYYEQRDYEAFSHYIDLLEDTFTHTPFPLMEAKMQRLKGKYYFALNETDQFEECYNLAIKKFNDIGLFYDAADLSHELANEKNDLELFKQSSTLYKQFWLQQ